MDELEALLARRLIRGNGRFKDKLPLTYFKCNECVHIIAICSNNNMNDKKDKKEKKYQRNKDYKEKGKKSRYIAEKEHTKT